MGFWNNLKKTFSNKTTTEKEITKKYDKGLEKTRNQFASQLNDLSQKYKRITDEYFEQLEEVLIMADIGVSTVLKFVGNIKDRVKKEKIENSEELIEIIVDEMFIMYVGGEIISTKINWAEKEPTIILIVGVNGVGKTTSIGKLASQFKKDNKKVLLAAADTFRAGATEQLIEWGRRTNTKVVTGSTDPASVAYDAIDMALKEKYDVVLIDTAGRLQNKENLMRELEKINKVIGNKLKNAPHETILVIDATTGQNGISQAKSFKDVTNITGIILTKIDGTAKGGIVLAIKEEVGIPVKYVGFGEQIDDLQVFDIENYIYGLFKESE